MRTVMDHYYIHWRIQFQMVTLAKLKRSERDAESDLAELLSGTAWESRERLARSNEEYQLHLFRVAVKHNAHALFAGRFRGLSGLDSGLAQELTRIHLLSIAQDMRLVSSATAIMPKLRDSGVEASVYKGPLIWRALGMPCPSKISDDIDILVRPQDKIAASQVLSRLGYRCIHVSSHEAQFARDSGSTVDMHWSVLTVGGWGDRGQRIAERALQRSVDISIDGEQVRTLGPTDAFLILSLHSYCHHMCGDWASLYDIAQCTRVWPNEIDWDYIVTTVNQSGLHYCLAPVMSLVRSQFGAQIPDWVGETLELPWNRKGLLLLTQAAFDGRLGARGSRRIWRILMNVLSQPGFCQTFGWVTMRARHWIRTRSRRAAL